MSLISNKRRVFLDSEILGVLQEGSMPSSKEIRRWIVELDRYNNSSKSFPLPDLYKSNNILSSSRWNNMCDGLEMDITAISRTLDECWELIDSSVNNAMETLPAIYDIANVNYKAASRTLSMIPEADAFTNVIELGSGIPASSFDLSMCENIYYDKAAGTFILSSNAFAGIAGSKIEPISYKVFGLDKTYADRASLSSSNIIGYPEWILNSDVSRRFIMQATATEQDVATVAELVLSVGTELEDVEVLSDFEISFSSRYDLQVLVYTSYDNENYTYFGQGSGNNKIIVSGPRAEFTKIKIHIIKGKADALANFSGTYKWLYSFDINSILLTQKVFKDTGYLVSDAIDVGAGIETVSIDFTGENKSYIEWFIAPDIEESDTRHDFSWRTFSNTEIEVLSEVFERTEIFEVDSEIKYLLGPGAYMDIWQVGTAQGTIAYAEEGYKQLEIRAKNVDYEITTVENKEWADLVPVQTISVGNIILPDYNYFHLSTKIFASSTSSANMRIEVPSGDFKVFLNKIDVTSTIRNFIIPLALVAGDNILEIVLKTPEANGTLLVEPIDTMSIAINKLYVTTADGIQTDEPSIALHDGNIIVNRPNSGKIYRVILRETSSPYPQKFRVMAILKKTRDGASPTVRNVVVRTGV